MSKLRRVAVVVPCVSEACRSILRGVTSYAERVRNWELYAAPLVQIDAETVSQAVQSDGLISWVCNATIETLRTARMPVVAVHYRDLPVCRVLDNNQTIARMAFEHLWDRGFRNFGFAGSQRNGFSVDRLKYFRRELEPRGLFCHTYHVTGVVPHTFGWHTHDQTLMDWLRELPKPIGIFTANDFFGQQLLLSARHAEIRVPDDVAVIGVDNDELICRASTPQLSSIDTAGEHIGFEAAALLDKQMKGECGPGELIMVEPRRLIVRQSSDVFAIKNADVAEAMRFIRENTSRSLSVDDVVHAVAVARRTLERAFRNLLGRSIYDEIAESKIRLARQLLMETDLGISDITLACGFHNRTHLNAAFRKRAGHSPAAFRRTFRRPG